MPIKRYAGDKFTGLSSDTKPTAVPDGATFYETDTLKTYVLSSAAWIPLNSVVANNGITSNSTGTYVTSGTGIVVNTAGVHVNSSYIATLTANDATNLGGIAAASYVNTSQLSSNLSNYQTTAGLAANVATLAANSATFANSSSTNTFTVGTASYFIANGNVGIGNSSPAHKLRVEGTSSLAGALEANGTLGTAGQVLTSNSGGIYWSTVSGVNTAAQYSWTNTHTFNANLTIAATSELIIANGAGIEANGTLGTAGQVLTSNSTGVYWSTVSGGGSVNTAEQYVWTNTHTWQANINYFAITSTAAPKVGIVSYGPIDLSAANYFPGIDITSYTSNSTGGDAGITAYPSLTFNRYGGNTSISIATPVNRTISAISSYGSNSTSSLLASYIETYSEAAFTTTAATGLRIYLGSSIGPRQVMNIDSNGAISDVAGKIRDIPIISKSSAYQLSIDDAGECISTTSGGIVVNGAVLAAGFTATIFNNSASNTTITSGAGVTMYLAGSSSTGNRTLLQRGLATVVCVAANTFAITGSGLF